MPLISVSDELAKKSFTSVENKFISKYLPVLDPNAVKVYLYALYIHQNGLSSYTLDDFAAALSISYDDAVNYFTYLEEFELVSVISHSPFEVKILDAANVYGTPKKYNPEKYSDFTKSVQNILSGRMISTNEFREYFYLLEEYGFEPNALLMIINYCVNLKGNDISVQYIKKVAKSFAEDGVTSTASVEAKLSAYNSITYALNGIFAAIGIKRQPDVEDNALYKKWTEEFGFTDNAVIAAAKQFKVKSTHKLDGVLNELYKNKKFDVKEIADYCKNKNSVYAATMDIAKALGIYIHNPATYVETYVNVWCNYGYSFEGLKKIAEFCFKHANNSFEDMDAFLQNLYGDGIVADESIDNYIAERLKEEDFLRKVLAACGLTRKIIAWDRECLKRWRGWNFSDTMILEAAHISSGKSNPVAYLNGILASWKNDGIFTPDKIQRPTALSERTSPDINRKALIEQHYYDLRHNAESKAEQAVASATADPVYGEIFRRTNELSIQLAFAEINDKSSAEKLEKEIAELEKKGDLRLSELGISRESFIPQYSCKICNDTGYDKFGKPCECLKKFLKSIN